jgi:hypothetical protein
VTLRLGAAVLLGLVIALPAGAADAPAGGDAPAGKRVGPPDVPPVRIGPVRYETLPWGRERGLAQNGGYIAAIDAASGKELWVLRVYRTRYDPKLESDVQDVFIESMAACHGGNHLCLTDERGGRYEVNPVKRSVRTLPTGAE